MNSNQTVSVPLLFLMTAVLIVMMIAGFARTPAALSVSIVLQVLAFGSYYTLVNLTTVPVERSLRWFSFSCLGLLLSWQSIGWSLTLLWLLVTSLGLLAFANTQYGKVLRSDGATFLYRMLFTGLSLLLLVAADSALHQLAAVPEGYSVQSALFLLPLVGTIWLVVAAYTGQQVHPNSEDGFGGHPLPPRRLDQRISLLQETLLLLLTVLAPLAHLALGDGIVYIVLSIMAVQALQSWRGDSAASALARQLNQITALDHMRETLATQVTREDVLDVLQQTLSGRSYADNLMIVLYDSSDYFVEYPLIAEKGRALVRPPRRFRVPELHEVFPASQPVVVSPDDLALRERMGFPEEVLGTSPAVAIPLMASDTLIGVIVLGSPDAADLIRSEEVCLLERIAQQAALSLRNAMLYHRTTHIALNLSIVNQSVQDVTFNLNREEALKRTCQIAAQLTNAQKSAIYLVQTGENNLLRLQESLGLARYRDDDHVQRIAPNPAEIAVVETGTEPGAELAPLQRLTKRVGAVACMQIPLRSSNMIIGKLIVFHDAPRLYNVLERGVLEALANQASAAIDNSDLLQALERFATEQADLVNLSRISSEDLDMERILRAICEVLGEMFLVDRVEIGIIEGEALRIYTPGAEGQPLYSQEVPLGNIPEFQGVPARAYQRTVEVYDQHSDALSDGARHYWAERGARTVIVMGMQMNQQPLGVVMLMDQQQRTLSEDELHLLEMVTNQITGQIHNAHVYALTEAALVQRLQQLILLEELTQQIAQSTDLDLIIDTTLEAALQATGAEFAALALHEDQSGTYKLIWQERQPNGVRRGEALASPEPGIVRQVARTGEVRLIFDNRKAPGYHASHVAEQEYLSALAVPLHDDNRVIGVLRVESTQLNHFTEAQVGFISNLAEHAAISIEKARMLAERQRRIQMLTLLRNLSMETLSTNNPQHVAHIILRTALQMLDGTAALLYVAEGEKTPQFFSGLGLHGIDMDAIYRTLPEAVLRRAVHESTTQMISDVERSPLLARLPQMEDLPYRSLILVPVLRRGIVHEVLCVIFEKTRSFGLQDLNAVDLLAAQISSHLENARLNEALHVSHDRIRAILNSTHSSIILLDMDGVIQDLNTVAEKLVGVPAAVMRQQSLATIIQQYHPGDGSWQQVLFAYHDDPELLQGMETNFVQDGKPTDFKTHVFPVLGKDEEKVGRLLVFRDITEEKDLERYQHRIQRMIVHDLVGPLGAIITGLSFTKEVLETPQEDEDVHRAILSTTDVSLDSAYNLLHMVETLRDLPKTAKLNIFPTAVAARELIYKARDAISTFLVSDRIAFECDADDSLPWLYVDNDLIRRVIINLLHNAFKFTPEGGKILVAVDHAPQQEGFLRLRVCDTGPGIPPAERERIFQEYTQIEGRLPRAGGRGMGLGLHFCKLAVEAHGGVIGVETESGLLSGACISFTVPRVPAGEDAAAQASS